MGVNPRENSSEGGKPGLGQVDGGQQLAGEGVRGEGGHQRC